MAATEFKAFRGLRYDAAKVADLAKVVAPPYDVISPADRERYLAADPHSVVRLILPSAREQLDGTDAEAYRRAAACLRARLAEGLLLEDPQASFYAYEQVATVAGERLRRRGVIGALRLATFAEGKVLPHEHTHDGPKRDRFELMKACDASLSPIFALYPDAKGEGAACDSVGQRLTGNVLHGYEADAIMFLQTVDRGDVGVVQSGQQLGLTLETGEAVGICRESLGQEFDRSLAVERSVDSLPDHAHPALADLLDQAVMGQGLAGLDRHAGLRW